MGLVCVSVGVAVCGVWELGLHQFGGVVHSDIA